MAEDEDEAGTLGPETMADARHPEIKAGPIDAVNLHRAVTRTPMSRRAFTTECAFPSTETATAVLAPQPDRDPPRDETAEELEDQARTTVIVPDLDPSIPAVLRAHVPPEENAQACPCLCHHAMTSTLGDPPMPSSPLVEILTPPIRTRALAEALTTIPTVTVPNIAIVILTDVAAPALLGVLGVAAPARIRIPSAVVQWIDMTEGFKTFGDEDPLLSSNDLSIALYTLFPFNGVRSLHISTVYLEFTACDKV